MTLQEIIADIHALKDDLENYERKYGVLSETFYEAYAQGKSRRMKAGYWIGPIGRELTKFYFAARISIIARFRH